MYKHRLSTIDPRNESVTGDTLISPKIKAIIALHINYKLVEYLAV